MKYVTNNFTLLNYILDIIALHYRLLNSYYHHFRGAKVNTLRPLTIDQRAIFSKIHNAPLAYLRCTGQWCQRIPKFFFVKGSFISKGFCVLAWKILISHFGNKVSALEWKFLLKFEFWRTFRSAHHKSAPKFKFQKEFPLQGRNFVAKMGDENFLGQHTKSFRDKATFNGS